ncbi:MAG: GNAT family N-acetyltransferase [Flavobacterium sp.]|nr:GNAT family N-acetyltransferase [Flavobacterium sp.]
MAINFKTKKFNELTIHELYQILQLRSEVFVVEQNCVFQDMDYKDQIALHVLGIYNDKIIAYTRLFKPNDYYEFASIGRVVIDANYRDRKWGNDLVQFSIKEIKNHFGVSQITIGAQLYLQNFYEKQGFVRTSDIYLEDDIEHIKMKIL